MRLDRRFRARMSSSGTLRRRSPGPTLPPPGRNLRAGSRGLVEHRVSADLHPAACDGWTCDHRSAALVNPKAALEHGAEPHRRAARGLVLLDSEPAREDACAHRPRARRSTRRPRPGRDPRAALPAPLPQPARPARTTRNAVRPFGPAGHEHVRHPRAVPAPLPRAGAEAPPGARSLASSQAVPTSGCPAKGISIAGCEDLELTPTPRRPRTPSR